jgi:hypothetical protein
MDWAPRLKNWRREGLGWQSPEEQPQSEEDFELFIDIESFVAREDGAIVNPVTANRINRKRPAILACRQ